MADTSKGGGSKAHPIPGEVTVRPFRKGDYDADVEHFTGEIARSPGDPAEYKKRAYAHYLNDDYDLAITDYTEAIRLNPNSADLYAARARARADKETAEDRTEAIADLGLAIRLDPTNEFVFVHRGSLHSLLRAYDDAIADLSKAIALNPHPSSYHSRGCAYHKVGDLKSAIADFNEAIRQDPEKSSVYSVTAHAYASRGEALLAAGKAGDAIADFDKAVRLGITGSGQIYRNRGLAWQKQNDLARAIEDLSRALHCHMTQQQAAATRYERAQCRLALGSPKEAEADLREALRLDPSHADARGALGQLPKPGWLSRLLGFRRARPD